MTQRIVSRIKNIIIGLLVIALSACGTGAATETVQHSVMATDIPVTPTLPPPAVTKTPTHVPPTITPKPTATAVPAPVKANTLPTDGEMVETLPGGLQYIELVKGQGPTPQEDDIIILHYTGMLEDGTKIDSSYDRGQALMVRFGQERVIADWDEGIKKLQIGTKAKMIIPPDMAYGEKGVKDLVPANATVIFEVELVAIVPTMTGSDNSYANVAKSEYLTSASGLKYFDLATGNGPLAEAEQMVSVHYTGWLNNGVVFDSTLERGQPFSFVLGRGQVIKGWDEGIAGMKVGGRRQLIVPPELAYGKQGAGDVISADETLLFEVELVEVQVALPTAPDAPIEIDTADYSTTKSGLSYFDIEAGTGSALYPGQIVTIHYTGWFTDGTRFDSSLGTGNPLQFPVGIDRTIAGWDEGILSMRVGGKRQLVIPSQLAYGEAGIEGFIPPHATLIFEIELLGAQ